MVWGGLLNLKSTVMATITRFEDIEIWQLAHKLYVKVLVIVKRIRKNNDLRFAEQMKSAAGSIMDNIAEGFERNSRLEFVNSLSIAKGENGELKSQFYRCLDDQYIDEKEFSELYEANDILSKKLASFIIYVNGTSHKGLKFKDRIGITPGKKDKPEKSL
jgi:four helix bundle protein